jgi:DNA-binding response OmpR family regulator
MLLKLEGYEPRVAGNRDEIVAALRVSPLPDVILLDVNLPGTDGFDILARVRQHPALREIPVIMLTAQTSRRDVLRGLAGGANGYITKPFDHEALVKSLRAVLGLTD